MGQTDAMLFEHWLRDRNPDAFKLLATRYAAMVYHTCRRILDNPTEAEDVTQECFVILASTSKPIGGYLAPWLHRVAYNRSLARLRAENRRRDREVRYAAEQPVARDMAWDEIGGHVDEAIAELPDKLRVPVVAYFLDGQSHEGIAQALGIPRSTVTYRVDKGVECLRKSLKGRGVSVAGTVLAGTIKANAAAAAVPSSVVANLGKLALSGVTHVVWPAAAAAPLAKTVAGFWTAKTLLAAVVSLAVVLGAGWEMRKALFVPDTPITQTQVSSKPSITNAAFEAPFTTPPTPTKAASAAPTRRDQEKNASDQATPPNAGTGMTAGRRIEVAQARPSTVDNMLGTISGAWQSIRGTLTGENQRRSSCQNNLKQMGLVFKMFANEAPGQCWPPLSPNAGHLMCANDTPGLQPVFPTYLKDPRILICPSDSTHTPLLRTPGLALVDDHSYYYLGYAIRSIEELEAFSDAYVARIAAKLPFDADLDTPAGKIYRFREGVERFFITDANNPAASAKMQSEIPVLIEAIHHIPEGGNVLFMDGHVEFWRYTAGGQFPMNKATMDILKSLSAMKGAVPPVR